MQIRTALAIGTGVAVGTVIGICVSEDTKIKLINGFKKKLIFALTGEKWEPRKPKPSVSYASYNQFYNQPKPKKEKDREDWDWDRIISTLEDRYLTFDSSEKAREFLQKMTEFCKDYDLITAADISMLSEKSSILTPRWHDYTWSEDDLKDVSVIELRPIHKFIIKLPKGRKLE